MADNFKSDTRMIFMIFFGLIIATTLIVPIANQINAQTETVTTINQTVTAPAINATLDLAGRSLITQIEVINASNGSSTNAGMFLQTGFGTSGLRTVQLTLNDAASNFSGTSVNVSYTYEPNGFVSGGSASLMLLVLIFAALGALIFAVVILFQGDSFRNLLGRKK